ncbi:MAG: type I secretion system permease/ATPase [Pseudomonadota bacterium]
MTNRTNSNAPQRELQTARNRGLSLIAVAFIFSIFVNILMLTGPLFMLQVYDRVLASRSEETLAALFLLVAFLYGLMALLEYARGRVVARFGARFQDALDARTFEGSMRHAIRPDARARPISALRDLETLQGFFTSPVMLALMDLPWTPLFLGAIFIFHPVLGWLATAGGVVLIVIALLNQFLTHRRVIKAQTTSAEAHAFSEQARQAAELVHAQGMIPAFTQRWLKTRADALRQTISASDWTGSFTALSKSFRLFMQSAILAAGAYFVLQNEMTAGAMIASSILLGRALAPIEQTIGQWPLIQRTRTAWVTLGKFLQATPPEEPRLPIPRPKAWLTAKALTIVPPEASKPTLRNASFSLEPGQAIGVIGKSGSGKTTLAKALLGLWQPTSGEVRLSGATLDQYDPADLGRYVGYLPQHVTLFNGTVAENIARLSTDPDAEAVIAAAKAAKAHDLILTLPKGYDTFLDGNDCLLSGGQKQRIALARALYGNPVLLILDEPNSALDAEGTDALNTAIRDFKANGKSALIMTHRPMAISECDQLLVIKDGMIVKSGPRDEVLKSMVQNAADIQRSIEATA